MKALPPTLRDRRRYVLARIQPWGRVPDSRGLYHGIASAFTSLFGDAAGADARVTLISVEKGYAIFRCVRGHEGRLCTAITSLTLVDGKRISLHTIATSGTLHSLRRRISPQVEVLEPWAVSVGDDTYEAVRHSGQKVDLFPKGIKNEKELYFTQKDLEKI